MSRVLAIKIAQKTKKLAVHKLAELTSRCIEGRKAVLSYWRIRSSATGGQLMTRHLMPANYFILSVGAGLASCSH